MSLMAEGGGGLIITVSHNVLNNIAGTSELKKLTSVSKSFCELTLFFLVLGVEDD